MIDLFKESRGYKPFRYTWAYDMWQTQQRLHWLPEEVPLSEDCKDWMNISDNERSLLQHIFRFFTQSDIDVGDNYINNFLPIFKPVEIRMMLASFVNMETVHIDAYAKLIDTVGMPETEFSAFFEYQVMCDKHNYIKEFNSKNPSELLKTIAIFGGFIEGLQLFASFAMLLNFPRFNVMKGMGQIITWSVRDESLHCNGMSMLYFALRNELGGIDAKLSDEIISCVKNIVNIEDKFIDLAFSLGEVNGMSPEELKAYVRYTANCRLEQFGFNTIYNVTKHPLPWLLEILNNVEHANFFETRSTDYSKSATAGDWGGESGAWGLFDNK